jgi:hypothetical protein
VFAAANQICYIILHMRGNPSKDEYGWAICPCSENDFGLTFTLGRWQFELRRRDHRPRCLDVGAGGRTMALVAKQDNPKPSTRPIERVILVPLSPVPIVALRKRPSHLGIQYRHLPAADLCSHRRL